MSTIEGGYKNPQNPSIIYSFKSRWMDEIHAGRIQVFFRKRGPSAQPKHVFFYVGTPVSSVVGYAEVQQIKDVNLKEALSLTHLGSITEDELISYIGINGSAKAIFLTNYTKIKRSLTTTELRRIFNFHPPQNFMQISKEVEEKILEAGNEN